jgi:hypothetical protein
MTTSESFDYERALFDPCAVFGEPAKVLSHSGLDATQKRAILERWRDEAARLSESEGENMCGSDEPMLPRVCDALAELERRTSAKA